MEVSAEKMRVLLVDNNVSALLPLKKKLSKDFITDASSTVEEALYLAQMVGYDAIVSELFLSEMDGTELCGMLRSCGVTTPVMILTTEDRVGAKVKSFECGADDYLVKPFDYAELMCRLKALSRRSARRYVPDILSHGDITMDFSQRTAAKNGFLMPLSRKEFDLLEYLILHLGRVLSREAILNHVWEQGFDVPSNTVDVHIKFLRRKLGDPTLIQTVYGIGYKFKG